MGAPIPSCFRVNETDMGAYVLHVGDIELHVIDLVLGSARNLWTRLFLKGGPAAAYTGALDTSLVSSILAKSYVVHDPQHRDGDAHDGHVHVYPSVGSQGNDIV